eukprot:scaffold251527_cov30-Tisochrysis_lutea.AAC.3
MQQDVAQGCTKRWEYAAQQRPDSRQGINRNEVLREGYARLKIDDRVEPAGGDIHYVSCALDTLHHLEFSSLGRCAQLRVDFREPYRRRLMPPLLVEAEPMTLQVGAWRKEAPPLCTGGTSIPCRGIKRIDVQEGAGTSTANE